MLLRLVFVYMDGYLIMFMFMVMVVCTCIVSSYRYSSIIE